MKLTIKHVLGTLGLLLCLASCGSKKGNDNNTANEQYARCGNDRQCNEQYLSQQNGPNRNGYYQGQQGCGGGYQCQVYNVPQYQNGCNYGCGTQQYVVAPQGACIPSQNIYGQGGSFYMGYSYRQ